jgi:hypothetical protein
MRTARHVFALGTAGVIVSMFAAGCWSSSSSVSASPSDADSDADTDSDTNIDTGTDVDTDTDTDTATAAEVCIDFDETEYACVFIETTALRDGYAELGVTFAGPDDLDGAGVLGECGGFLAEGYSAPNFAAFNCDLAFSTGGIPRGPETMYFDPPATSVTVSVGEGLSDDGIIVELIAYDASDALVDSAVAEHGSTLTAIGVSAAEIARLELNADACVWVFDDLCFTH